MTQQFLQSRKLPSNFAPSLQLNAMLKEIEHVQGDTVSGMELLFSAVDPPREILLGSLGIHCCR